MASFSALPLEILRMIGDYFTNPDLEVIFALGALAGSSRRNHWIFNEQLYQVDARNPYGSRAMIWAAGAGQIETMKMAVASGANVNWRGPVAYAEPDPSDDPNRTPPQMTATALQLAVENGKDAAVQWLLAHGARLDIGAKALCECHPKGDPERQTWPTGTFRYPQWYPLHTALCNGRVSTFRILVEAGASLDKLRAGKPRPQEGPTALQNAAYAGNAAIFDFILKQPDAASRLDAPAPPGKTPLDLVYQGWGSGNSTRESRAHIFRKLAQHGVRLGIDATTSKSVLLRACCHGIFGAALDILESGACPWLSGESMQALLYRTLKAPGSHNHEYVKLTNDNASDRYYRENPEVRQRERQDLVKFLVYWGANIHDTWYTETHFGETAAMLAARPTRPPSAPLEMVKLVRSLGVDLQARNSHGMTVLHYLVLRLTKPPWFPMPIDPSSFSLKTLEYLVRDANLAPNARDNEGKSALDYVYDATLVPLPHVPAEDRGSIDPRV
ncbi:ankyrin repeat-containing domain protein [Parachaetomium inaequale]|uniref:Ankyrin repeat-containing domain protein n=1 Tax=Parachaetomium inaequale TaxID=2588326 RepID=A0AAN6SP23_9PEZI|nr:ankyrin repeat-containing domain protein [Parachaetomium inaequale]